MDKRLTVPSSEVISTLDDRRTCEPRPKARTEAQRDRDRVLYCSAFLRLGHVTQVAAPEVGHTFHSRLTHSLKVAQVARGLAQHQIVLAGRGELDPVATRLVSTLDPDAAEAAALAHDLGHPPFGHIAERVLQTFASEAIFEGNPQSFRIVTRLARRSAVPAGLNLTRRTLNGLLKYPWLRAAPTEAPEFSDEDVATPRTSQGAAYAVDHTKKWGAYGGDRVVFEWAREGLTEEERTIEAELMDWADDVTYAVHDMDDFYRAGLIPLERLTSDATELGRFKEHLRRKYGDDKRLAAVCDRLFDGFLSSIRSPFTGKTEERVNLRALGSTLIGRYIAAPQIRDSGDLGIAVMSISQEVTDEVRVLKELTWFYVIDRPSLSVIQRGQAQIIETLFKMYTEAVESKELHMLPPAFAERVAGAREAIAKERVVVDLIAGMTESHATEIYRQRVGVSTGSLLLGAGAPT